jgi:bifunctional DNA-binding transcriptional regulator/antitoxin component of YhaV-PrlF toxin-antitoxin module
MPKGIVMLARLSSNNQLTLPDEIISRFGGTTRFEVEVSSGKIVLTPLRSHETASAIRQKVARLEISEKDAKDAVRWARNSKHI